MYLIASFLIKKKKKKRRKWFTRHANLPNLFKERPRKALKSLNVAQVSRRSTDRKEPNLKKEERKLRTVKIHHSAASKAATGDAWFTSRWWKVIQSENYRLEGAYRRWCLHFTHKSSTGEGRKLEGTRTMVWYCQLVHSAEKWWFSKTVIFQKHTVNPREFNISTGLQKWSQVHIFVSR